MPFTHNLIPIPPRLPEAYVDGKRFYKLPNGEHVPSVTTVLSELSKDGIAEWRARVGAEEANRITKTATNRGTRFHDFAERYMRNDPNVLEHMNLVDRYTFDPVKEILDKRVNNIKAIEYPLYSYRLKTAGRTDLIAEWDGVNAIIDFKTSTKLKLPEWVTSYLYQGTAYSLMFQERTGIICPDIVIIIAVDHEEPQIFHKKRKDYVEDVVKLFTSYNN